MPLAIIERELRAVARHSLTYSMRLIAAVAALVVFIMIGLEAGRQGGMRLFGCLHGTLFATIWVLGPLLAADSISRERREGTLPLLFLTPLRPLDIVKAKGMAHGLRAFTLWLAVLPILTIPFVGGGVSWNEVTMSVLINFGSLCLAISAGLAASAVSKTWTRSMAFAVGLAALFWLGFICALVWLFWDRAGTPMNPLNQVVGYDAPLAILGLDFAINWRGLWPQLQGGFGPKANPVLETGGLACGGAVVLLIILTHFAAWRVDRTWQELPRSPGMLWLEQKLFSPVFFKALLQRWLRRRLERNPIGWLEQRSWSGRLVVWSWLAVVACLYSSLLTNLNLYQRAFHAIQSLLATLLALSIGLCAAGSFRRERETGVLELLLVAPLEEWQIIGGRVRGIYGQFLPAVGLLNAVWLYCATFLESNPADEFLSLVFYLVTFATLPVVGLYFSLTKTNFIGAFLWTVLVQLIGPWALAGAAELWLRFFLGPRAPVFAQSGRYYLLLGGLQLIFAVVLGLKLEQNLRRRTFALQPGAG